MTVAALFVQRGGVYWDRPDVDAWDAERDARLYAGPWPVVAHPPCNAWSLLVPCAAASFGTVPGEDGGCFEAALDSVRAFGGVLEHPAHSRAWDAYELPVPSTIGAWSLSLDGEWVAWLDQHAWGHPHRKATWLYYVGDVPPPAFPYHFLSRAATCADQHSADRAKTPPAFADFLLDAARGSNTDPSELVEAGAAQTTTGHSPR